jgi:hypothetical protein
MHTDPASIIKASLVVIAACLGCALAVHAALRTRNWLYLICALGSFAVVAGVVGQRVFPSDDLIKQVGADAAEHSTYGPWDAGLHIPVIDVKATPVAVGGVLVAMLGLSLVLFFEADVPEGSARTPRRRRLEEDDAV